MKRTAQRKPIPLWDPSTAITRVCRIGQVYGVRFRPADGSAQTDPVPRAIGGMFPLRCRVKNRAGQVVDPELWVFDDEWLELGYGEPVTLEVVCPSYNFAPTTCANALFNIEWSSMPNEVPSPTGARGARLLFHVQASLPDALSTPILSLAGLSTLWFYATNPGAALRGIVEAQSDAKNNGGQQTTLRIVPVGLGNPGECGTLGDVAEAAVAPIAWSISRPLPPRARYSLQGGAGEEAIFSVYGK